MTAGENASPVARNWADDIDGLNHDAIEKHLRAVFWTRLPRHAAGAGSASDRTVAREQAARAYNVLFLCTGNSARSIIAEAILDAMSAGRFKAYSAGSHPKGQVHPLALELLAKKNLPTQGLRSKDWSEFARPGAPRMDFVFTVCDNAAGEVCPVWPGQPMTAHWGIPDPAAVEGSDEQKRRAFFAAYQQLSSRLTLFLSLPLASHDRLALQKRLDEIGSVARKERVA
jgi:protein-tyrosine-phosphatase